MITGLISGCYRMSVQSFINDSVLLNHEQILKNQNYTVLRHFYRELQIEYVFGFNESEQKFLDTLLKEETEGSGGVINLRIQRSYRALDAVVGVLTLGVYTRSWLIVEGDIIRWSSP
ncbi:hypothetical protein COW36_14880 [bacterium (Candidatus Blackallbacteria) CG17_big_fil_post_rev_8_21_14_2_50_48_46]|uniref:Uncharacterized protein n=1 Tax=bacterium (Candidatus Blackallbacteria) CG17_big_fil_post_rev_8_21_14_2_50_48_46 TaxID=2014261 RepID=A0A2M7G2Q6_9BACT|nr:MAG: hypothetical protein COW64_11670 [bacterium (Candidatus Blackallbacteria) CG18_big_fil_WC_8_21_14_2_50_49_26]PIW15995.1 MAG: hypothetical protein COW36_14880 [bacterium (Candidatus Blackallbacteria) CG17_big_fil_post_rev_8_21_14_2_50_48_46]PIW50407.1 MAG: hypothetical protein COW20_02595 [bacterium (Candidatus Blackallbacteria) CG13_big_fil_rev_8_21_14_2_50_49_14]